MYMQYAPIPSYTIDTYVLAKDSSIKVGFCGAAWLTRICGLSDPRTLSKPTPGRWPWNVPN